jgi:hypothetical protein
MSETAEPPPPRIRSGELIGAISALVLLPAMFVLEWYGVVALPGHARRSGITSTENAWRGLTSVRWLMLVTIAVVLGSVILHATQRSHGSRTDTSLAVAALGTLTAALLVYRVLIELPNPSSVVDAKIGAFVGLLSAIGIALGGYESVRERRAGRTSVAEDSRAGSHHASQSHAR